MDPNFVQKRMQEIQQSGEFSDAFSKIVSRKAGYKAVIEKKQIIVKCPGCQMVFENHEKFCPECGTKINWPKK